MEPLGQGSRACCAGEESEQLQVGPAVGRRALRVRLLGWEWNGPWGERVSWARVVCWWICADESLAGSVAGAWASECGVRVLR